MERQEVARKIRVLVGVLRESLPPSAPVRVYFRGEYSMPEQFGVGNYGLCVQNTDGERVTSFSIFIRYGTLQEMADTLCHEWAHSLSWDLTEPPHGEHGPAFGIAYAQVLTALEGV